MTKLDLIAELLGDWSKQINGWSILLRLILAFVIATVIGCERATKRHAAGLRTFILISMASTLGAICDLYFIKELNATFSAVSAAAVIAVAIISCNTILFNSKNQIRGLTTSAALWAIGLISILIGLGLYTCALIAFAIYMASIVLFPKMEKYLKERSNHFEIHLELKTKTNLQDFVATIRKIGLQINDIETNSAYINSGLSVYSISLTITNSVLKQYKKHSEIISALSTLPYVYYIEETN